MAALTSNISNIGWDTDFTNVTSNLTVTALYSEIKDFLRVKENGNWVNISKVYKKISGVWVEQSVVNWNNLFNENIKYRLGIIDIDIDADLLDKLIDFEYIDNRDGSVTLTAWKGTLNGVPSTELVIPDDKRIIL